MKVEEVYASLRRFRIAFEVAKRYYPKLEGLQGETGLLNERLKQVGHSKEVSDDPGLAEALERDVSALAADLKAIFGPARTNQ